MGLMHRFFFGIFLILVSGQEMAAGIKYGSGCQVLSAKPWRDQISPQSSQILVVTHLQGIKAKLVLCQKHGVKWNPVFLRAFDGVIGKNGLAPLGFKKEGDLKTPEGLYPIGETFGTAPLALKMDYKYITAEDKFIDDLTHQAYNTWVFGQTDAKSYEKMLIQAYALGAVINYNMNPIRPGSGSAIFIHLWDSPQTPTSGCVALGKRNLLKVLYWLDKAQFPFVLIH